MKLPILYLITKVGLSFPYSSCCQGPTTDMAYGHGFQWVAGVGQGEKWATRANAGRQPWVSLCFFCIIPQGFKFGQHCINVKTTSGEMGQTANVTQAATKSLSSAHVASLNDRHMASIVARPYARAVAMGKAACLVAAILWAKYRYDLESLPGDTVFLR